MAKCVECRYYRADLGSPDRGVCIYGRKMLSGEETTAGSGVDMDMVKGHQIGRSDEACEYFESKKSISRRQWLAEGR